MTKVFQAVAGFEVKTTICELLGIDSGRCSDLTIHIPVEGSVTCTAEMLIERVMVEGIDDWAKGLTWQPGNTNEVDEALRMWDKIPFPQELRHTYDFAGRACYRVTKGNRITDIISTSEHLAEAIQQAYYKVTHAQ